jgi:hypothetical protein
MNIYLFIYIHNIQWNVYHLCHQIINQIKIDIVQKKNFEIELWKFKIYYYDEDFILE